MDTKNQITLSIEEAKDIYNCLWYMKQTIIWNSMPENDIYSSKLDLYNAAHNLAKSLRMKIKNISTNDQNEVN